MGDLISRQAAIDAIHCDITVTGRQNAEVVSKTIAAFVDRIKALPSAQPEPRWIPVSERLPEEGEEVLATHLGGLNPNMQVIEHIYERGTFCCGWEMDMDVDSPTFGQRYMGDVIAWMPLPEPYREDGEQDE